MKRVIAICFLALVIAEVHAICAYPYPVAQVVNGRTFYIHLFGDEHHKWAETEDGYTLVRDNDGQWCYALTSGDTSIVASLCPLGSEDELVTAQLLHSTPKHLRPFTTGKQNARNKGYYMHMPGTSAAPKSVVGERRVLVILMSFQNRPFIKSRNDYNRLFNEEGYADDHAQGSVRDFYLDASYRQLSLQSDIYGPFTAKHDMAYYGKNSRTDGSDTNPYELFVEAINLVASETDLHLYDGDNDGYIDNVHIIFAGYGEEAGAAADAIWSHEATFYRPYEIQGLKIDRYSCAPELRGTSGDGISRIGPHCHEIGHALGAMDFYDTNYETNGQFLGTGVWDVMAQGSWNNEGVTPADFNPYVKAYNYGWVTPQVLPPGEVKLRPSCETPTDFYLLKSSEYGDYYLMENRSKQGWGSSLPGNGLLIFHIHSDIGNAGNDINTSAPQMCYVVCASSKSRQPGRNASSYGDINSSGCPYPGSSGNSRFGTESTPQAFYWDGSECGININHISLTMDGNITLFNESEGSAYKPQEWLSLFYESFESNPLVGDLEGGWWMIVDNPENTMTILNRPIAYKGVRSLQLTSGKTSVNAHDTLTFNCLTDKGTLRLKVSATAMRPLYGTPNTVVVGYRQSNNTNWYYSTPLVTGNNRWRQFIVDLPENVDGSFKIIGNAYGGSILAIDDIEVEQAIGHSDELAIEPTITPNYEPNKGSVRVFTLAGQRRPSLGRGLNIIRDEFGNTHKVIKR